MGRVPHIVACYGKYTSEKGENYIVTEFMSKGNLLNLLRNSPNAFNLFELMDMALDACKGMVFLSERNMVHRDLSARNLLVTKSDDRLTVKV